MGRLKSEEDADTISRTFEVHGGDDEADMSLWNAENIPLLQRTVNQVRVLFRE